MLINCFYTIVSKNAKFKANILFSNKLFTAFYIGICFYSSASFVHNICSQYSVFFFQMYCFLLLKRLRSSKLKVFCKTHECLCIQPMFLERFLTKRNKYFLGGFYH